MTEDFWWGLEEFGWGAPNKFSGYSIYELQSYCFTTLPMNCGRCESLGSTTSWNFGGGILGHVMCKNTFTSTKSLFISVEFHECHETVRMIK